MSHEQLYDKFWHRLSVDPNPLDDHLRRDEEQLVKIFKVVSEVFPSDPFPFGSLERYRTVRRELDDLDTQVRLRSDPFSGTELRGRRDDLFRHALELFEADLRLARKQKLARMALSHDWSGMPSYVREGFAMWKCRFLLRSSALLSSMRLHRAKEIRGSLANRPISASLPAGSFAIQRKPQVSHSELRSNLERLGVAIVRAAPDAVIRTGSLALDEALGIGGFPRGRIVEIFGKPGAGKTTLALTTAANAQRHGKVAYVDEEHKLHFPWARTNGMNVDEALILQGTRAKNTMDSVLGLIRSGDFALVVVDTVAALFPDEDLEACDGAFTGEMSRLLARTLPRIASAANRTRTCVLLLNQIRQDEKVIGRDLISPGGEPLAHYSSIRLELSRSFKEKDGDNVVGCGVHAVVLKSCVGPPFRIAVWNINFERGADLESELIGLGVNQGVISKETTGLRFGNEHLGSSNNAAREFILRRPELATLLETQLRATMKRKAGAGR